jgi:hypothetical protein
MDSLQPFSMKIKLTGYLVILLCFITSPLHASDNWKDVLEKEMPALGHRNWIVIADAAYPLQTAPGVETVVVDADPMEVLRTTFVLLKKYGHVQPVIYTDTELGFVAETDAPGIGAYRHGLDSILAGRSVRKLPHEAIIHRLDEAGRTFKVLLIKTPLKLPYTSVFLQLECGYWNEKAEAALRKNMTGK